MVKLTFGNLSVDMRKQDEGFGMAPVGSGLDFLERFEPLDISVLVETPSYVEGRMWNASNELATLYLWVTGQTPSSVSLSKVGVRVDATGFYSEIGGNITFDASGNFYGTATSLSLLDRTSGALYLKASGFSLLLEDDTPQLGSLEEMTTSLAGNDSIVSGAGNDYLLGFAGNDVLRGNGGIDTLRGGSGNDVLWAAAGNDKLYGDSGADTMLGGAGNDTYYVASTGDKVYETTSTTSTTNAGGIDKVVSAVSFSLAAYKGVAFVEHLTLSGSSAINGTGNGLANKITGNGAANTLKGGSGNDSVSGGNGSDTLYGEKGNDTLYGNSGNDLLRGGAGNDLLYGGTGKDVFRLDAALSASTNVDRIRDFSVADDTIQLENAIFTRFGTKTGPIASGNFKASTTGRATDSNDYILYETDTGKIFYDADGNGAGGSVQIALVGTQLALTAADFVLV